MKKSCAGLLCILLLCLCACGQAVRTDGPSTRATPTAAETTSAPTTTAGIIAAPPPAADANWREAYRDYLLNDYEIVHGYIMLGLADLDKSGIPELIIFDSSGGSLGTAFAVATCGGDGAAELIKSGTSSSFVISDDGRELYFYRDFNSMHSRGGTYGYGYVTALKSVDGVFTSTPLLQAKIADYSFDDYDADERLRSLAWEVDGEENVLQRKEFAPFLSIQKAGTDGAWEDISGSAYLLLKRSYLGESPENGDPYDLPEIRSDEFEGMPPQGKIDAFFGKWDSRP